MSFIDKLSPCQWAFVAASTIYPLPLYFYVRPNPTAIRLAQCRESISLVHCTLMTLTSLLCLHRSSVASLLEKPSTASAQESAFHVNTPDKDLPIITTQSTFANALTTFEAAYLLQDSVVLFYADRLNRRVRRSGLTAPKGLNIKHLAWHHAGLSAAFALLQCYIYQGREKGVLIIIMMMLMNASSPFGTIRWFLVTSRPHWRRAIAISTATYLTIYAICRVYLVYYVLKAFGAQKGQSAFEAYRNLRWQCQAGTGTMAIVNTSWLIMGVTNFARRSLAHAYRSKRE